MPATRFEVFVFDFDGTLVNSAAAKRQAFFDVFPAACAAAVAAVLARDPDGSRHKVIPEMIAEADRMGLETGALDAATLVEAYGEQARERVRNADAVPGARHILASAASRATVYIASMTPQEELQTQLAARGWTSLVREAFGFPQRKPEVVARLLQRHAIGSSQLLVIGDGISDREAAERNGCAFHAITGPQSLLSVPGLGDWSHV